MTPPPPAILIAWCDKRLAWRATALVAIDGDLGAIAGPTTSEGRHPADALQALQTKRFGLLFDDQCAPTSVMPIEVVPEQPA